MDQALLHWMVEGMFAVLGFLGTTVVRNLIAAQKEAAQEQRETARELGLLRVHIADNYVRRDELQQQLAELGRSVRRIEDRLVNQLQDRRHAQFPELFSDTQR